jgi:putative FmdB family regulatory protein
VPTYSYACTECGHTLDAVQAFTEDALTTCPQCTGRLRKLFNSVGVVFKGSGFYRNDSREAAKSSSANDSGSPAVQAGGDKTGSGKSDSTKSDSTRSDSTRSDSTRSDSTRSGSAPAAPGSTSSAPSTSAPAASSD